MAWEPPELETDPDAATVRILQGMAERMPGWVPVDGAPEVALAQEIGRETANVAQLVSTFMDLAIAGIGETVFGVVPYAAQPATLEVLLYSGGPYGRVVPAGFTVVGRNPVGEDVAFVTTEDHQQDVVVEIVTMTALEPGAHANGVPADDQLRIVTASDIITGAAVNELGVATGGVDEEPLEAYLTRLRDYLQLLHPAGVIGRDLATLLRVTLPGVHRAIAIDGWNAELGTGGHERTVTVWAVDELGSAVEASDLEEHLEPYRETNLVLYGAEPTYTPLVIEFQGTAVPGADPELVRANVVAAIAHHLDPGRWGATTDEPRAWTPTPDVNYLRLAGAAGSVAGLRSLDGLLLGIAGGPPPGTDSVRLPGAMPLPAPTFGMTPTTITGTIA
ncbi:baseplate J/gp47 family protein [Nocardioides sp. CPCC 205120]|uniref:baseplate J/gp47 family protein n=1 Tax=Nocardioides sp. CPCC 205120 TaxID=3406462 RepID=UPI003B5140DB